MFSIFDMQNLGAHETLQQINIVLHLSKHWCSSKRELNALFSGGVEGDLKQVLCMQIMSNTLWKCKSSRPFSPHGSDKFQYSSLIIIITNIMRAMQGEEQQDHCHGVKLIIIMQFIIYFIILKSTQKIKKKTCASFLSYAGLKVAIKLWHRIN